MTVIVCIGSRGEMLFGGRRVSRDANVLADIASLGHIVASPFSEKYLAGAGLDFTVMDAPLENAGREDILFIEEPPLAPHKDRIDRMIVYDFGEVYPLDVTLDITPTDLGLHAVSVTEFAGKAHKLIKKEIFER
jgi:hypothetical protein